MEQRIFVGVSIPDEAKSKISNYTSELRREFAQLHGDWEKPEKLHLTLKFLGKINDEQLRSLKKIVAGIAPEISPFSLKIQNTGVFPSPSKARVLWLDIADKTRSLIEINHRLKNECGKIGFARETRKYVPHLTVARIKESEKSSDLVEKHLRMKFEPVEFEVSEIIIYESNLQKTGSVYSIISKYKFEQS